MKKMNVLQYVARCTTMFNGICGDCCFIPKTNLFTCLSIVEFMEGKEGVQEYYTKIFEKFKNKHIVFSEFVMYLNWKISQHYESNDSLAELYNKLWQDADNYIYDNWNKEQLSYYFKLTD